MINIIKSLDVKKYEINILMLSHAPELASRFQAMGINCIITNEKFFHLGKSKFPYCEWSTWRFIPLLLTIIAWIKCKYYYVPHELKKYDYDILVLNSSCLTAWLKPNNALGKKSIIHIQEPIRQRKNNPVYNLFFKRQLEKYADSIIAISEDNAIRTGVSEKAVICRNFAQVPTTEPSKESYSSQKVLYLGGSSLIKGFNTVVNALPYLNDNIMVYVGGALNEPPTYHGIKKYIKSLLGWNKKYYKAISLVRNAKNVKLIGLTDEVNKYLYEVCCLISPFSKPHFSRPVIESYLHKKPVIVTDIAGMREFVSDKGTGLIVPNNNPIKLAEAINYMCSHPIEAQKMGETAYVLANKFYIEKPNIEVAITEYNRVASLI